MKIILPQVETEYFVEYHPSTGITDVMSTGPFYNELITYETDGLYVMDNGKPVKLIDALKFAAEQAYEPPEDNYNEDERNDQ